MSPLSLFYFLLHYERVYVMKIKVTQGHIDAALYMRDRANFLVVHDCPVALALWDIFHAGPIMVGDRNIYVCGQVYQTPPSVENFILEFDSFEAVKPFEFELELEGGNE
jgi:hypothetical protein